MSVDDKQKFRTRFLKIRKALSRETVENRSLNVVKSLEKLINNDVKSIMFYMPINNEVDVLFFANNVFKQGKTILFPKLVNNKKIIPYIVNDIDFDFKTGAFGIPEPDTEPYYEKIDLILVPGVVFDKNGGRIGYGKGFFDMFLFEENFKQAVGIAFDFQVLDKIPVTEKDYMLKKIACEKGIIEIKKQDT